MTPQETVARGLAVRARRVELGLSQRALAERAGLNQSSVSRLEAGAWVAAGVLERVERALEGEDPRVAELRASVRDLREASTRTIDSLALGVEALLEGELAVHRALGDVVAEHGPDGRRLSAAERVAMLVAEYDQLQADFVGGAA